MNTMTPTYHKEIVYSRADHDYAMYLDGEIVGYANSYSEAENALDELVSELLSGQYCADLSPTDVQQQLDQTVADTADMAADAAAEASTEEGLLVAPVDLDGPVVAGMVHDAMMADMPAQAYALALKLANAQIGLNMHVLSDLRRSVRLNHAWKRAMNRWRRRLGKPQDYFCHACEAMHATYHCPEIRKLLYAPITRTAIERSIQTSNLLRAVELGIITPEQLTEHAA